MANKTLFKSLVGKLIPQTNAINEERAPAYKLSLKHQLAQYAATGCLNTTFYATADEQLAKLVELCAEVDAEFIAKRAVFCRERGLHERHAGAAYRISVGERPRVLLVFQPAGASPSS
jgi:60 kDa SS-A/Ro ribonucleoprotein